VTAHEHGAEVDRVQGLLAEAGVGSEVIAAHGYDERT